MKTLPAFLSCFMLAFCMSASAQTSSPSDSQMKGDTMNKSDTMKEKSMTMVGCVSEKDGKYMLMNKQHPDGMELMGSEDLKPHVGHKVKVTGMMENGSMMNGGMKSDNMSGGKMMKHGMIAMNVTSMKMMSDQCNMNQMMHK